MTVAPTKPSESIAPANVDALRALVRDANEGGTSLVVTSSGGSTTATSVEPGDVSSGEVLFTSNCLPCHGAQALGTDSGPPLVHDLYLPGHHADVAFTLAVRNGVRPHHWQFGTMPPITGLSDQDIAHIVAYVRSLQREAGLLNDSGA